MDSLLQSAKAYIISLMSHAGQSRTDDQQEPAIVENVVANMQKPAGSPPQKRFKFLAKKLTTPVTTEASLLTPDMELASYIVEYQAGKITTSGLEFWQQKQLVYSLLAPLALDLIFLPATEVYSERVFPCVATSVYKSRIDCQEILNAESS